MTKRLGFTLAEVLITLGIIGVVAAMTIPTLVKNYQKTVWVNQLKKSVSTIEQGFQKMLADDGVDNLSDTELGQLLSSNLFYYDWGWANDVFVKRNEKKVYDILNKYFKINYVGEEVRDFYYRDGYHDHELGDAQPDIYLLDGSSINFEYLLGRDTQSTDFKGRVQIDVNGDKAPNTYGSDVFIFEIYSHGNLIPCLRGGSHECLNRGTTCADRIIKNGWKMDY